MHFDKLVIMQWQNFDKRNSDLFAISELLSKGVQVEYWDVSDISIPGYQVHPYEPPVGLVTRKVSAIKEYKKLILSNNNSKTAYLLHMTFCNHSYRCFHILSKYRCTILYCINGCLPSLMDKNSSISKLKYLKSLSIRNTKNLVINKMYWYLSKTPLISETKFVLATCGEAYGRRECKIGPTTKWIAYNSCDYQQCLAQHSMVHKNDSIVFIDQNLPFHPDNKLEGLYINAEGYFAAMNILFDEIERKYNKKVIIAAHPSCYDKYLNGRFLGDRDIVQGETLELVKGSWAVIAHNSTAISFPIIFDKPLILVTTEDMHTVRKHTCKFCELYSRILNCVYIKSENEIQLPDTLTVDADAYSSFKYQYLTNKDSESVSNGDILYNVLQGE